MQHLLCSFALPPLFPLALLCFLLLQHSSIKACMQEPPQHAGDLSSLLGSPGPAQTRQLKHVPGQTDWTDCNMERILHQKLFGHRAQV